MNVGEQLELGAAVANLGDGGAGRAIVESMVRAQRKEGVWSVERSTKGRLWLRPRAGRWSASVPSSKQVAPVTAFLARSAESDQAVVSLATHWVGDSDADATATWLEVREAFVLADGSTRTQASSGSWLELLGGELGWVAVCDGLGLAPLPPPPMERERAEPDAPLVLSPTAAAALCVAAARELDERAARGGLRLGRDRVGPDGLSLCRDPRIASMLPALDAEGTPRRYLPIVSRGVAVGLLCSRDSAAPLGMSRSSGSLLDFGDRLETAFDALAIAPSPRGGASAAFLAAPIVQGWMVHALVEDDSGCLFAPWAARISTGEVSTSGCALEIPLSPLQALARIEGIGGQAEVVALARGDVRPLLASCPPMRLSPLSR